MQTYWSCIQKRGVTMRCEIIVDIETLPKIDIIVFFEIAARKKNIWQIYILNAMHR